MAFAADRARPPPSVSVRDWPNFKPADPGRRPPDL